MLGLPTININGGHRISFNINALVTEITKERHWKNLWIKKTKKFYLEICQEKIQNVSKEKIEFPKNIIIHDFSGDFDTLKNGDKVDLVIGYADQQQQYWHRIREFSISILINGSHHQLI